MSEGASFWDFLHAFLSRWFIVMSGPATVPFAVVALYVNSVWLKALFGLLAVGCAVFSSYWVWRRAQLRVLELEEAVQPKIEIIHDPSCLWCQEDLDGNRRVLRIGVRSTGAATIDDLSVGVEFEPRGDALGFQLLHPGSLFARTDHIALHPAPSHQDHFNFIIAVCDGVSALQLERLHGPWTLKERKYTVAVVARGRNVVESRARFELTLDSVKRPHLVRLL
jgi:hypothetical protein